MIPEPEEYFKQFLPSRDALLLDLEEEARVEEIPIIGPVVGQLLYILANLTKAGRILELGTATGYSALWLARGCEDSGGQVISLEHSPGLAARAVDNFKKAGLEHRISVKIGEARKEMEAMTEPFDMIFLDIDKEFYLDVLDECARLLKIGGLLIADNVGFKDAENFNRAIFDLPEWRSVHLLSFLPFHSPENDGLCLAVRV
jgi:predicted O-methyltransferase YrrM